MVLQGRALVRMVWTVLLFMSVYGQEVTTDSSEDNNVTVTCVHYHDNDKLDVRSILGKWKALELYLHLRKEGTNIYKSCPRITIWEAEDFPATTYGPATENQLYHVQHINAKFRQEYRHLRLLWNEAGIEIEYSLYFRNDSAGYWQVAGGQNGTGVRNNYQQFTGSVQVLKAVNDHLVLNFCQEPIAGRTPQLYTVLLSRDPGSMHRWERDSVHTMLQTKQLSVSSIRMVCGNSASMAIASIFSSILTVALTRLVRWSS